MSLAGVAKETLAIVERGEYTAPSGHAVPIGDLVTAAAAGTLLYRPGDFDGLPVAAPEGAGPARFEVTPETSAEAARRLVEREGVARVVLLNFASAKNPGGGFLGGAKAQEEDLARCSALYRCLTTQRAYYDANRATPSMLYTHHIIYAPDVPFFRDERLDLLERPFVASVITAPAPNAGEALRREQARADVRRTLIDRAGHVLAVAAAHRHRCLVLGAWGCGVFRNDPDEVADAFGSWLEGPRFAGAFARVVFAIRENPKAPRNLAAFRERFG
jgi:uncharacterized protein (TIGR02452 family)